MLVYYARLDRHPARAINTPTHAACALRAHPVLRYIIRLVWRTAAVEALPQKYPVRTWENM